LESSYYNDDQTKETYIDLEKKVQFFYVN
jgi:hypothetical protein